MGISRRASGVRIAVEVAVALAAIAGCSDDGAESPSSTTPTSSGATTETTTDESTTVATAANEVTVQVFFLDEDAFNIGRPPYVVPVDRIVPADTPELGALEALFGGPTQEEIDAGLLFVASGATGIADLRIADGTAHVQLAGGCSSGGSTFTVADEIAATMRQFEAIVAVKIYDPQGRTEAASEPGDSIPECLEP